MLDFYKTGGGKRFVDSTVPELIRQIKRLADATQKANRLKEIEMGIGNTSQAPDSLTPQIPANWVAPPVPDEEVSKFVEGLMKDLGGNETATVTCCKPDDLRMLKDAGVIKKCRDAGFGIEWDDAETEATLAKNEHWH